MTDLVLTAATSCRQQALCWRWNTSDCWLQCIHYTIIDLNLRRFKDLFLFQIFLFKVLHEHSDSDNITPVTGQQYSGKTFCFLKYFHIFCFRRVKEPVWPRWLSRQPQQRPPRKNLQPAAKIFWENTGKSFKILLKIFC